MIIRVLRSARRTVADGIMFYERQQAGLGAYFLSSIMSDLRSLNIYAGVHRKFSDSYYRMVCTKFPYSIYYQKDGLNVDVYAVLDDRRDPEWAKKTLERTGGVKMRSVIDKDLRYGYYDIQQMLLFFP